MVESPPPGGIVPPVEVRYDDFTSDIEENRLLRAALDRLERIPVRHPKARQPLKAFEMALGEVSLVEYDARRLPAVLWTRLNEHYHPAVEVAKLILRSVTTELRHGRSTNSAFLVDMSRVFEDFVVVALRECLGLSERSFPQGAKGKPLYLDADAQLRLKPDISWWEGGQCIFVGDVKYRNLRVPGMQHADLYQLLAYAVATGLLEGLLIYAAGEDQVTDHDVIQLGRTLRVRVLDPSGQPGQILARIEQLATRIKSIRTSHNAGLAA